MVRICQGVELLGTTAGYAARYFGPVRRTEYACSKENLRDFQLSHFSRCNLPLAMEKWQSAMAGTGVQVDKLSTYLGRPRRLLWKFLTAPLLSDR